MAAHLFGYVGEVNDAQVDEDGTLKSGDIVGQQGIEKVVQRAARWARTAPSGRREQRRPRDPDARRGSADRRAAAAADDRLRHPESDRRRLPGSRGRRPQHGRRGRRARSRRTGKCSGSAAVLRIDPNAFAAGIDRRRGRRSTATSQRPLQDRAIQGRYSPGSTFKMAVRAGRSRGRDHHPDFKVYCPGHANFYGREFHCWMDSQGGHGTIDLRRAIAESCDVYFYTVANMVGIDKINKWATALGLGVMSGIDLPNEVQGLVPSTPGSSRRCTRSGTPARRFRSASARAQVSVTPVSMAVYVSALANGGTRVTPHLLKAVDNGSGWKPCRRRRPSPRRRSIRRSCDAIRDGMWQVVNGAGDATGDRGEDRRPATWRARPDRRR